MAAKKKKAKKASSEEAAVEVVDPREPIDPTAAALSAAIEAIEVVLADVPPPEEPTRGDLVTAMLHFQFAEGLACGYGQEALRRIEESLVDRNEFRVTEAFEVEDLLTDLELPDAFDRCLAAQTSVAEVYNDQNGVNLDYLREAAVSDRNMFFQRVPAISATVEHFLVQLVSWEEITFSDRSSLRTQQRLGIDPKAKGIVEGIDKLRAMMAPYGHFPVSVGPDGDKGKPNTKHMLSPACIIARLGPQPKKRRR